MLFSATDYIDSFPDAVISAGEDLKNTNTIFGEMAGNILIGRGEFINIETNFVGDVVGFRVETSDAVVNCTKKVTSVITNAIVDAGTAIVDGAVSLWNKLFS